jgi:hypothetical protein
MDNTPMDQACKNAYKKANEENIDIIKLDTSAILELFYGSKPKIIENQKNIDQFKETKEYLNQFIKKYENSTHIL